MFGAGSAVSKTAPGDVCAKDPHVAYGAATGIGRALLLWGARASSRIPDQDARNLRVGPACPNVLQAPLAARPGGLEAGARNGRAHIPGSR